MLNKIEYFHATRRPSFGSNVFFQCNLMLSRFFTNDYTGFYVGVSGSSCMVYLFEETHLPLTTEKPTVNRIENNIINGWFRKVRKFKLFISGNRNNFRTVDKKPKAPSTMH